MAKAKALDIKKWLVAGAAGALAWLCIHRKKSGVSGIGAVRKKKYKFLYRVTDGAQILANALRYTTEPKIVFNYQNSDPVEFEFGHFGIPRNAIEVERSFGKYFKPIDFAGVDVYERVAGIGDLTAWNKRHLQDFFESTMWGDLVTLYIAYEDERGYIPVGFTYGGHNYEGIKCLISPNNIDYLKELCGTYKCDLKQVDIYPGYIPGVRRKDEVVKF